MQKISFVVPNLKEQKVLVCSFRVFKNLLTLQNILYMKVPKYLAHVDRRLKEENDRLLHYLDQSTR